MAWRCEWPARLYALLCCWLAWGFARNLWGEWEGLWAAGLLGFFLVFDFPAAVIPLASDLLMLAPHLAAVWLASRGRAWLAGALAGVAFLVSPKGVLVLAACLLWARPLPLAAGFAAGHRGGRALAGPGGHAGRLLGGGLALGQCVRGLDLRGRPPEKRRWSAPRTGWAFTPRW